MSQDLKVRVQALEKVVNNILKPNTVSKEEKASKPAANQPPAAPTEAVVREYPFKLVNPKYDVPWEGTLTRIDKDVLMDNPALLKHVQETYPECFAK